MDFSWSEEQWRHKRAVIAFAQKELNEGIVDRDRDGHFRMRIGRSVPGSAYWAWSIPEKYGGN